MKYYSFKIARGALLTLFLLLILYSLFSIGEYLIYFPSGVRKMLFYGFVLFGALLTVRFILFPFLKLIHVLRPLNLKESAEYIRKHFPEMKDKLLNVIELSELKDDNYSSDIVLAGIDQKIGELKLFNFREAVQFKDLRIVLYYFLFSLLVVLSLFVANKAILTSAPERIIRYNTHFEKPAPFNFVLVNADLQAVKGETFTIRMICEGEKIPGLLYINIGGENFIMKKQDGGKFSFEMASVIQPVSFYFTDLKYRSDTYRLELLPKPGITHFDVMVDPPAYTRLAEKSYENTGDLTVPLGSRVKWTFQGIDIDTLYLHIGDSVQIGSYEEEGRFISTRSFHQSAPYYVFIKNDLTEPDLALSYHLDVLPDLFPEIDVVEVQDSVELTRFYFRGVVHDDYGFSNLQFHYNINNADSAIAIPFVKTLQDQDFYFSFDFAGLSAPSGTITYYFSVTDNDMITGFKTTTSDHFVFTIPDREELLTSEKEQYQDLEDKLKESQDLADQIQDDLQNLRLKNMDSNISDWEKTRMVNDILKKQSRLEQLHEQIKQNNERLNDYMNSFSEQNEEIKSKQLEIEKLLEEVFTDELKKLLEEFQKLAEDFNSQKLNQLSEEMDLTYDDLKKQLDRNMEMLKKMKVEQMLQGVIDDLNQVGTEEEEFVKEIDKQNNFEEIIQKVRTHQEEIESFEERIGEALQKNQELEKPLNFDDFSEEFDDINKSIDESIPELEKGRKSRSVESLQQTVDKIQNTAFAMQQMLNSNRQEGQMENIENLRQILSNLIFLSFEQEDILVDLNLTRVSDPVLNELNNRQKRIERQSGIVKDSLYALAKRTPQLTSTVNNELLAMELNLAKAQEQMEEALLSEARASQQYVMTAANNLALILNEALENMEEQMANAQPGDQQCENPGNKPGMGLLKKASENIRDQLQQMIDQMKQGNPENMNRQMGQSLMQHEMMQQMLRNIMNEGSVGSGAREVLQQIDRLLEQNRKQLMEKNVNAQMIQRQNQITTRLLEAENAELERDLDEKRESEHAEDFYSNPVEFFEYTKDKDFSIEFLNKNVHKLSPFYKGKYKEYLNHIEEK